MARLTNLADRDIAVISSNYGLEIIRYQPVDGGDANSSFLLKVHEDDYVLTFYEKKSFSEVEHMALLLNHLAAHGYYTNQVIPAEGGSFVIFYQDKPVILKKWIHGETLRDTRQKDYRSIGRAIAELHKIPTPKFLPRDHPYGLRSMPASLDHQVDLEYEAWLVDMLSYLQGNFPAGLPQALIHGDLFDDNIIFRQGAFKAIIDFGDACNYHRAYDLGSVLFGACMEHGELDFERSREVLKGYQELVPLEPDECIAVQFFAVYAGAAISAWHYLNSFIRRPADSRNDKYKLAAQRTTNIYHIPQSEFN
jgi:homoserine kinase type II